MRAIVRTPGLRFILPCLVKALGVLGRVGRLACRVPSLVAAFVPPLIAWRDTTMLPLALDLLRAACRVRLALRSGSGVG